MTKKAKERERERARQKETLAKQSKQFNEYQRKGPALKALLGIRGCQLNFYDYLDSYEKEFRRIKDLGLATYPSLLGVFEVDDKTYGMEPTPWSQLGLLEMEHIIFDLGERAVGYGSGRMGASLSGFTSVFKDGEGRTRTAIVLRRNIKVDSQHRDFKYSYKIAALSHELGHVHDVERGSNFNVCARTLKVIEAEVFANIFALELLAGRHIGLSYGFLYGGLEDAIENRGYLGEVARAVMEACPRAQIPDWQEVAFAGSMTPSERRQLGPEAVRILNN